jgi:predicted Zn finger-like uncharacterized protein
VKFLCEQCKAKYQIADEKAVGKTVRMKCRKCGHLIEVRAAVTETSVSSALPRGERPSAPPIVANPPPKPQPPPPRAKPISTDAAGEQPAFPRPHRIPGALEGAFKSAVQHESASASLPRRAQQTEEEISAPFDMADLSPSDEWYVAINGVPVGPVRVAEVRRKAALGAVTEDSLVWQEGLDEWRPLRLFPELAASVREAMSRGSRPPLADTRSSLPPPPSARAPARLPGANAPRMAPPRGLPAPSPSFAARSNVVPFVSRLATAEKLEPAPQEGVSPLPGPPLSQAKPVSPSVIPDPFASAPAALATAPAGPGPSPIFTVPPELKKSPPWTQLAMVAAAVAFGITAAFIWLSRPSEAPPAPVIWPAGGASAAAAPTSVPAPLVPAATSDQPEPTTTAATPVAKGPSVPRGAAPPPLPAATALSTGRSLDLHSLAQSAPTIAPAEEPGGDTAKPAAGQSLTEGQVQQVIAAHRTAIGRVCWERNPSSKAAVNVSVMLTVGGDGSAQNVSATGDESSVAKCIENEVRGWRFPATGSSQRTNFSLKFVRQ